jgi:hypothetical protein
MSAPLQRRNEGDALIRYPHRNSLNLETQSIQKPSTDHFPHVANHVDPRNQVFVHSRSQQVQSAAAKLRQSIQILRALTIKTAEDLRIFQARVEPPDPGIISPYGDVKRILEEEDESRPPLQTEEKILQAFKKTKKRIDYSGSMADYADSMAVNAHSQSGVSNSRATSIKSQGLFLHVYNPR